MPNETLSLDWNAIATAPLEALAGYGRLPDDGFPLTAAALALAAIEVPGAHLAWYADHLDQVAGTVASCLTDDRLESGALGASEALSEAIAGHHGYRGDDATYDDLQNANLIRVIDRRRGLPVALAVVFLHAGRLQGWRLRGIAFPGHFLVRLDIAGERLILDPFHGGQRRGPRHLEELLGRMSGEPATPQREHTRPISDRALLIRLANNAKIRHFQAGRQAEALEVLDAMRLFAPAEPVLWRETALMNLTLGRLNAASDAASHLLTLRLTPEERASARRMLDDIARHRH